MQDDLTCKLTDTLNSFKNGLNRLWLNNSLPMDLFRSENP